MGAYKLSKKRPEIANSIVAFIDALAWKDEWKERKNSRDRTLPQAQPAPLVTTATQIGQLEAVAVSVGR